MSRTTKTPPKKPRKSPRRKTNFNKPEQVISAKQHKAPINQRVPNIAKHGRVVRLIIGLTVIVLGGVFLFYLTRAIIATSKDIKNYNQSAQSSQEKLEKQYVRLKLIGNEAQRASEIVNYSSAPEDLQQYLLRDYAKFKNSCIVNDKFVGPVSYEVVNIVYDSFAKISKNCQGQDSAILAKIGGRWTELHSGQSAPNCQDVNGFSIPQGISQTCTDGKRLFPNPNP